MSGSKVERALRRAMGIGLVVRFNHRAAERSIHQ